MHDFVDVIGYFIFVVVVYFSELWPSELWRVNEYLIVVFYELFIDDFLNIRVERRIFSLIVE